MRLADQRPQCIMDGKYGDDKSNIYEGVENVTIEGNLFKNCLHPVNMGESEGPTDPPRGITFLNNHSVSNEGSPLFTIESDVQFSKIDGNRVYSSTGNYGPLPPGSHILNAIGRWQILILRHAEPGGHGLAVELHVQRVVPIGVLDPTNDHAIDEVLDLILVPLEPINVVVVC